MDTYMKTSANVCECEYLLDVVAGYGYEKGELEAESE